MRRWLEFASFALAFALTDAFAQNVATQPLPANVVFVPHPSANRLAKHPTLPVLYLGLANTPDSRNLVTFSLDAGGNVLTNSLRAFEDYFTDDGKNPTNLYSVLRPIVLAEEKILLLAATPASYPIYDANSNAQHVAAVALDDQGQPAKLIKAFRTTHTEAALATMVYEPSNRRLYLSYSSYWGWVSVGKNGVPSREFHMLPLPWNLWEFAAVPEWQRFCGVARGTDLCNFRLTPEGARVEFFQMSVSGAGNYASLQISPSLRKIYVMNGPDYKAITVHPLDKQGRFVSVPRRFPIGESMWLRIDSKARRLYSITQTGTIRIHPLDGVGYPMGSVEVFQASCGTVRDAIVDEPSEKLYVACTEPAK